MKEKKFKTALEHFFLNNIKVGVYYSIDDNGNVLLDEESMIEEFNEKLGEISELANDDKDELQKTIEEKLKQIKEYVSMVGEGKEK